MWCIKPTSSSFFTLQKTLKCTLLHIGLLFLHTSHYLKKALGRLEDGYVLCCDQTIELRSRLKNLLRPSLIQLSAARPREKRIHSAHQIELSIVLSVTGSLLETLVRAAASSCSLSPLSACRCIYLLAITTWCVPLHLPAHYHHAYGHMAIQTCIQSARDS